MRSEFPPLPTYFSFEHERRLSTPHTSCGKGLISTLTDAEILSTAADVCHQLNNLLFRDNEGYFPCSTIRGLYNHYFGLWNEWDKRYHFVAQEERRAA